MVKRIVLYDDNEDDLRHAEIKIRELAKKNGWECEIKGYTKEYLDISSQRMVIRLEAEKIRHIESHNHKIYVYTDRDVYVVYEKLSDILNRLPYEFVQCHKSFLVNLDYVAAIEGREVVMKEGKRIAISRTYYNQTRDRFLGHMGKNN